MIYIFEDNKEEKECRLFDQMYPKAISDKFIYAGSNTLIQQELDNLNKNQTEEVVVFLDVVPDNQKTATIYRRLVNKNKERFKRFIVLPIPCREYYFIKQLQHSQVVKNNNWVSEALARQPYKQQQLLLEPGEADKCRTFEKFCKRVAYKQFKYCVIKNKPSYFDVDCLCNDDSNLDFEDSCRCEQLKFKKQRYLASFPCFPSGNMSLKSTRLQWNDIIDIHRHLVNEYNQQAMQFRNAETNQRHLQRYQIIKAMY